MDNIFHIKSGETLNDLLVTIKHSNLPDSGAIDVKINLYVNIALPHDFVYKKRIESFLVTDETPTSSPDLKLNLVKISSCDTEFVVPPSGNKCYINCDVTLDRHSYNIRTGNYDDIFPDPISAQDAMKMINDILFPDLVTCVSMSNDQMNMVILCELIERYHKKSSKSIFGKCKSVIDRLKPKKGV